jgi:hypothetical protein
MLDSIVSRGTAVVGWTLPFTPRALALALRAVWPDVRVVEIGKLRRAPIARGRENPKFVAALDSAAWRTLVLEDEATLDVLKLERSGIVDGTLYGRLTVLDELDAFGTVLGLPGLSEEEQQDRETAIAEATRRILALLSRQFGLTLEDFEPR